MRLVRPVLLMLSIFGCGTTSEAGAPVPPESPAPSMPAATAPPDASAPVVDNGAPSDAYPAKHPAFAAIESYGGPVLAQPKVRPIFFPGDPVASDVGEFIGALGPSAFWKAATAEYGVGALVAGDALQVTEPAPSTTTSGAIESWLGAQLDGTHADWGDADPSTIYAVFYPSSTHIALEGGGDSCTAFQGYHGQVRAAGRQIPYVVIAECAGFPINHLTGVISHELYESATDPFPRTAPAWAKIDDAHAAWAFVAGPEIGDMCFLGGAPPAVGRFEAFPAWSNASLAAGGPPCVIDTGTEPYFNSAPVLDGDAALKIGVGKTKSIELDLFSNGKTSGPWKVSAVDLQSSLTKSASRFELKLDRNEGRNGEKLHLTVKPLVALADDSYFVILSTLGDQRYFWFVFVET